MSAPRVSMSKFRSGLQIAVVAIAALSVGVIHAAPAIFFTDILSGPTTGGEDINGFVPGDAGYVGHGAYLSIFGRNFGSDRKRVRVTVGGGEVARILYLGPAQYANGAADSIPGQLDLEQLSVQLGGNVRTGAIQVLVDGVGSNTDHRFTVRPGDIFFVKAGGDGELKKGTVNNIKNPYIGLHYTFHQRDFDAGDFIVIRGGEYKIHTGSFPKEDNIPDAWLAWLSITNGGKGNTKDNPLTVYGYPGETVLFNDARRAVRIEAPSGSTMEGYVLAHFKVRAVEDRVVGLGKAELGMSVEHIRLVNLDIHAGIDARVGVIGIAQGNHLKFYGIYIHDNWVGAGKGSKYTHQMYFSSGGSDDVEVAWSELARFDGGVCISVRKSMDIGSHEGHTNMSFHDMIIHDQTSGPIVFGRSAGRGIKFFNNLIYRTGKDRDPTRDSDTNASSGLSIDQDWGPLLDLEMYNNVIYDPGNQDKAGGVISFGHSPKKAVIRNNIFVVMAPEPYSRLFTLRSGFDTSSVQASNNLWWHGSGKITRWESSGDTQPPTWLVGSTDLIADPKFVRGLPYSAMGVAPNPAPSEVPVPDFRLLAPSPGIDAGTRIPFITRDMSGVTRPQGSAFDLGAFEFDQNTPPPPSQTLAPAAPRNVRVIGGGN